MRSLYIRIASKIDDIGLRYIEDIPDVCTEETIKSIKTLYRESLEEIAKKTKFTESYADKTIEDLEEMHEKYRKYLISALMDYTQEFGDYEDLHMDIEPQLEGATTTYLIELAQKYGILIE